MKVQRFTDVARFCEVIEPLLMRNEAANNFQIGLSRRLRDEPANPEHFFATVSDGDDVVCAAVMTPPWPLVPSAAPDEALDALAEYLHENQLAINEVSGLVRAASRCAQTIARSTNRSVHEREKMKIFQLMRVIAPPPASGHMRVATMDDLDLVVEWMRAFGAEIKELHRVPRERLEQRTRNGEFWLWIDGAPVSMAALAGPTPNGVRITAVYTPPQFRGRGYASNSVAQLSQRLLDAGRKFCFIYTDAANPTSNKIYQQIGYEFVCDWVNLRLV